MNAVVIRVIRVRYEMIKDGCALRAHNYCYFANLVIRVYMFVMDYGLWIKFIKIIKQQFLLIKKYGPGWVDGWMDGWMDVKAVLRIAYSNQKTKFFLKI